MSKPVEMDVATQEPVVAVPLASRLRQLWRRLEHAPLLHRDVLVASALLNFTALALPVAMLHVYDRIIPHAAFPTLALLVLGLWVALLFDGLLRQARAHIAGWEGARFEHAASVRSVKRLLHADVATVEATPVGVHMDRLASIEPLRDFYTSQVGLTLVDMPFALMFIGLLAVIGGPLALVPLALMLVFGVLAWAAGVSLHKAIVERGELDDRRYNFIVETLAGLHTVKGLAMENQMARRYERLMGNAATIGWRVNIASAIAVGIGASFSQITTIAVASIGSMMVIAGTLTVGQLVASTLLAGRAMQPVLRAMAQWTRFQSIRLAEQRFQKLNSLPAERAENAAEAPPLETLEMRGATFGYDADGEPLFRDVNLSVRRGEIVAITGHNGAGKSSLLWMMMGGLRPRAGEVLVDGRSIHDLSADSVRDQIAYLPQRGYLFQGTVLDNLTRFDSDRHLDEALELAAAFGLDRVFAALPGGFETPVGEGAGGALPGGCVQAIAMVRALVGGPRFILFDEANAAFDRGADERLKAVLMRYRETTGIVLVSFRPSLLALADRRYTLQGGTLVEVPATPAAMTPAVTA